MDTNQKVIHNGNAISFKDATINISNKALWFNFGVYESIKVIQGKQYYSDLHAQRLLLSASLVGIKHDFTADFIVKCIKDKCIIDNVRDGLIRMIMLGDAERNSHGDIYLFHLGFTFYKDATYSQGSKLVTFEGERFLPKAKSINTLLNYVAFAKAKEKDAIDALLVDHNGYITEGTRANFFMIKDGEIISPKAENILDGVTRIKLLELIKKNYSFSERNVSLNDAFSADECFITSTSMNIMPIIQIDDKKVGSGLVGKTTKNLIEEFRAMQKEYSLTL